jgi:hypothetical protein
LWRRPRSKLGCGAKERRKRKLSLCLTKHHAMKTYCGSGGIGPRILDLGTRWRWVVSFTPRSLYPQGKNRLYPLDRRLGGTQSRSGRGGEEKNSQPHAVKRLQTQNRSSLSVLYCRHSTIRMANFVSNSKLI